MADLLSLPARDAKRIYLSQVAKELESVTRFALVKSATRNDPNRNSLASSNLFNSIEAELTDDGINLLANFYWLFVDQGTKPGHMPPFSAIYLWAIRYKIQPRAGQTREQMVHAIRVAIRKRGIQARPFVEPAIDLAIQFINPFSDDFADQLIKNSVGIL